MSQCYNLLMSLFLEKCLIKFENEALLDEVSISVHEMTPTTEQTVNTVEEIALNNEELGQTAESLT